MFDDLELGREGSVHSPARPADGRLARRQTSSGRRSGAAPADRCDAPPDRRLGAVPRTRLRFTVRAVPMIAPGPSAPCN